MSQHPNYYNMPKPKVTRAGYVQTVDPYAGVSRPTRALPPAAHYFAPISNNLLRDELKKNLKVEPVQLDIDSVNEKFLKKIEKENKEAVLFNLDHANDKYFSLEHQSQPLLKKVDELGRVRQVQS